MKSDSRIPRIAVLGIFLESNAFAQTFARSDFLGGLHLEGDTITTDARSSHPKLMKEVVGFYRGMDGAGAWEPVPVLVTGGRSGGPAEHAFVVDAIAHCARTLRHAGPLDGVYLCNHGAMTTTEDGDPEGLMFEAVREAVGPAVPIVATLDLHANVSQRTLGAADAFVSYRTDPHVDHIERGEEAAAILHEMIDGLRPIQCAIRLPIVPPNVSLFTAEGPYGDLIRRGQQHQADNPDVLNVSIVAGFAFSDTAQNGLHVIVQTRTDKALASRIARDIAQAGWNDRSRFIWNLTPVDDAIARALKAGEDDALPGLLLADLGDNSGAGGPTNTLWLLDGLHRAGARRALVANFFDPALAERAHALGVGAQFDALFQGDDWQRDDPLLRVPAQVVALHTGTIVGRLGINAGKTLDPGPSALLRLGEMWVSVTSRRLICNDPAFIEMLGMSMEDLRVLVVKGRGSYRAAFTRWFGPQQWIEVDTPGRTSPVLTRYPWRRLPRPVWPVDRDFEWQLPTP